MQMLNHMLLLFILVCAVSVAVTKNLLSAIVIFMCQSLAMAVIWILLESPDLAITEAAVGAGISGLLLFVTLKKIHAIDVHANKDDAREARRAEDPHGTQDQPGYTVYTDTSPRPFAPKEVTPHGENP